MIHLMLHYLLEITYTTLRDEQDLRYLKFHSMTYVNEIRIEKQLHIIFTLLYLGSVTFPLKKSPLWISL